MGWSQGGIKRWAADDWFSKCVRLCAGHICEHCQQREATDCAHIYGRRKAQTRWAKDNAVALCRYCHRTFEENPLMMADWIDTQYPGRRERLNVLLKGSLKNNKNTRDMISAHYRAEYRRMESTGDNDFESWN